MITAHARNLEDVILWRALGTVENGRYVDVGAHDPDKDSVTRLFYEHAWRGINVEPVPRTYERLLDRRPGDVNVRAVCGDHDDEVTLYEVRKTGLSTLDREHARSLATEGLPVIEHKTPVLTLDGLLSAHGDGPIHFLHVDADGAEGAVLQGCDLARWRPWVLVIGASGQASQGPTPAEWEPMVLEAGYTKVYVDGVNRFYLSAEHAELEPAFQAPPNVFDEFVLPPGHGMVSGAVEVGALRDEVVRLSAELKRSNDLVRRLEELASANEDWARSVEALVREPPVEVDRVGPDHTAPTSRPIKRLLRPLMDAGLRVVRGNEALKVGARRVLHTFPSMEARLSRYAAARPPEPKS